MKQKYLREHIPMFDSEDNEELVESLLVLGINSFLEWNGPISRASNRKVRGLVGSLPVTQEQICLDFEKHKLADHNFRDVKNEIDKIAKKIDPSSYLLVTSASRS